MSTDVADRRSQILEAAAAAFAETGYRGTSVAAVAARVGITDAGVLYHFKTKDALLLGVLEAYGRSVDTAIAEAGLEGIDLLRAIREWGAGMEARPEISMLLVNLTTEYLTTPGPARKFIQAAYRRGIERYSRAFAAAAEAGHLRSDLDPQREASALIAHMDGIRLQWFLADRDFSMADSVRAYVDAALSRLAPV